MVMMSRSMPNEIPIPYPNPPMFCDPRKPPESAAGAAVLFMFSSGKFETGGGSVLLINHILWVWGRGIWWGLYF
ncbi:hypothetical protein Hanom_Chr01g00082361 [Helianthus anomalus]